MKLSITLIGFILLFSGCTGPDHIGEFAREHFSENEYNLNSIAARAIRFKQKNYPGEEPILIGYQERLGICEVYRIETMPNGKTKYLMDNDMQNQATSKFYARMGTIDAASLKVSDDYCRVRFLGHPFSDYELFFIIGINRPEENLDRIYRIDSLNVYGLKEI